MHLKLLIMSALSIILGFTSAAYAMDSTVYDKQRDRHIPFALSKPINSASCTQKNPCPVAIINAGYGIKHSQYQFLANEFNKLGYLTLSIAHELPNDPPLSVTGNLYQTRSENWSRGAQTLRFIQSHFANKYGNFDFTRLTLIGHSNGGDISSWLANEGVDYIDTIITLDHRRVPLPRDKTINVISIRASDFPADKGVLYSQNELAQFPVCVVKIDKSRHNDMFDGGPTWLKEKIAHIASQFVSSNICPTKSTSN